MRDLFTTRWPLPIANGCFITYPPTYLLTYPLTYLPAYSLDHLLAYALTHSLPAAHPGVMPYCDEARPRNVPVEGEGGKRLAGLVTFPPTIGPPPRALIVSVDIPHVRSHT